MKIEMMSEEEKASGFNGVLFFYLVSLVLLVDVGTLRGELEDSPG